MTSRNRMSLKVAVVATGLLIGWLLLCWIVLATRAYAHDALPTAAQPQGWSYPFACCSGFDCREVPDSAIVEEARGYRIRATGEFLPIGDRRLKDSPDGHFHWCSKNGAADGKTICLFAPPRGF